MYCNLFFKVSILIEKTNHTIKITNGTAIFLWLGGNFLTVEQLYKSST